MSSLPFHIFPWATLSGRPASGYKIQAPLALNKKGGKRGRGLKFYGKSRPAGQVKEEKMEQFLPLSIPVKRGCGVRIEGGIYIVTTAEIEELADYIDITEDTGISGKLILFPQPYPTLTTLKPFRGFRGFDKNRFFKDIEKVKKGNPARIRLKNCYYGRARQTRSWLHWIGNKYYSIKSFIDEAKLIGVSRRVPKAILKKMRWGDTIFLTSRQKGLKNPVIFGYFRLERIEGVRMRRENMPVHLQHKLRYVNKEF